MAEPLTHNLVHFTRYLRAQGLRAVPSTTIDLIEAARAVGLEDKDDAYFAFQAVTVSRPEDIPIFDAAFDLFFGTGQDPLTPIEPIELKVHPRGPRVQVVAPTTVKADLGDQDVSDVADHMGASAVERLATRDFSELSEAEHAEVQRLIARMVWKPATALSRRWTPSSKGSKPDLRRTLRQMTGPVRDLMPLAMSTPKLRRRPLLVIADVSGSMERYTEMLLYFVHAARGRLGRVEAFVFSTGLSHITRELRHRDPRVALTQVGRAVHDWSSGTLIGEAFAEFNRTWGRRITRGGPVAVVISDGWDRGDPTTLRKEFATFARSVHRVVWLNPLAGRAGFEPQTRGMRAVLPFVDDFLPVGNLVDLSAVVRLLESVPKRKELMRR
ncbi:MAG: VWA domain-containing protein [Acidimicrobiia bacterium]